MTRRESRGLVVFVITIVALISGGIIAYKTRIPGTAWLCWLLVLWAAISAISAGRLPWRQQLPRRKPLRSMTKSPPQYCHVVDGGILHCSIPGSSGYRCRSHSERQYWRRSWTYDYPLRRDCRWNFRCALVGFYAVFCMI